MALIQCTNLKKVYTVGGEEVRALDGVSLSVEAGDFIAICGPSGSGKSTLANVIGGLDQPDSGSVVVEGMDLAEAKDKQLSEYRNKHIGFVFQSFNLQAHESALENVISPLVLGGVGKKKERVERAWRRSRVSVSPIVPSTSRPSCLVVSVNAWPLRERWSTNRRSSSLTNPPGTSTHLVVPTS